jgi:hypothetical protein
MGGIGVPGFPQVGFAFTFPSCASANIEKANRKTITAAMSDFLTILYPLPRYF